MELMVMVMWTLWNCRNRSKRGTWISPFLKCYLKLHKLCLTSNSTIFRFHRSKESLGSHVFGLTGLHVPRIVSKLIFMGPHFLRWARLGWVL